MFRNFRYRLWTNANQERELGIMLETHRRLYNEALSLHEMTYQCYGETFSFFDSCRWLAGQRKLNPYLARVNYNGAQETLRRLDKAFQSFFRRVKSGEKPSYPRFKSRGQFESITFPKHRNGICLAGNRLRVQYVGIVRVKLHRPVKGEIKTLTIKREGDKWYLVVSCELPDVPIAESVNPPVGIDVGLESFLTTSDGEIEPNPRYFKDTLPKLRRVSRSVSRKKKGGKNRRKSVKILRNVHARVRNLRREHHHKIALKLVRRYGFIAVERLNIKGMLKNDRLSRAIGDAGWYSFTRTLKCKAESAGIRVVEVDPRGTSQQCSECSNEVRKDLATRWHGCPHCGLLIHRDHNAALNILARARQVRTEPAEANVTGCRKRSPRSRCRKAME